MYFWRTEQGVVAVILLHIVFCDSDICKKLVFELSVSEEITSFWYNARVCRTDGRTSLLYQYQLLHNLLRYRAGNHKKLSYCWETARLGSLPKIAEIDVEMTNLGWNDLQMYLTVIKSGTIES